MRQQAPPLTPSEAFLSLRITHFSFLSSMVTYVVVGEVMRVFVDDFVPGGFIDLGDAEWPARLALLAWAVVAFILVRTTLSDERALDRTLDKSPQVDDMLMAQTLHTGHIVRLALIESIAVIGLILYMMGANRLDLYLFCGIALAALISLVPTRRHWESAFRGLAMRHSGVSSMPW